MCTPEISLLELKFILLKYQLWLCLLVMGRCKWLLAGPGKGPGEWGESGFWQAGLWNKYQQQAKSTGTSRWGFSRKCSLFGGLQKDLEIQGVSLSKQAEERRKSSTRTEPSAAQRRGAAAGVMAWWRNFVLTGFAQLEWPFLCTSPALPTGNYLLHFHPEFMSVFSFSWGF